jgi:hypothetical protein
MKTMPKNSLVLIGVFALAGMCGSLLSAARGGARQAAQKKPDDVSAHTLAFPGEKHLAHIRQLTFGGQSAEAYFSADDKYLTFQHQGQFFDPRTHSPAGPNIPCDQIFTIPVGGPGQQPGVPNPVPNPVPKMISNGKGRTTCSYFFPSGERMLYSSTFAANPACPPPPDYSLGYVWPIYRPIGHVDFTQHISVVPPQLSDALKERTIIDAAFAEFPVIILAGDLFGASSLHLRERLLSGSRGYGAVVRLKTDLAGRMQHP